MPRRSSPTPVAGCTVCSPRVIPNDHLTQRSASHTSGVPNDHHTHLFASLGRPRGSRMNIEPEPRIGDAERAAAASALGEHFASGRLTREEYDERSTEVWSARTNADLRPMFLDLPPLGQQNPCLLYTSPSPRDGLLSRMPSSA